MLFGVSGRWSRFTLHRGRKSKATQSIGNNGDKVMKRDAFGEVRLDGPSLWVVGTESGLPRSRSASASHAPLSWPLRVMEIHIPTQP